MENTVHHIQESAVVPTFLLKLVNLLNDETNQEYISWNEAGTSFIVKDQSLFSKHVLPKYFKHNKFASFVRQLNMYGFRKITSITQSGVNPEKEEIEFYHYMFMRGENHLLEHIKRKVTKNDAINPNRSEVTKVLDDVRQIQNFQENIETQLTNLKQENHDLWREVVNLRQKHSQQQKVVNKLIQFLVNLVQQHGMGVKRKMPLMIEERSITSPPKYVKQISITDDDESQLVKLEEMTQAPTVSFPSNHTNEIIDPLPSDGQISGPYITDVTSIGSSNIPVRNSNNIMVDSGNVTTVTPAYVEHADDVSVSSKKPVVIIQSDPAKNYLTESKSEEQEDQNLMMTERDGSVDSLFDMSEYINSDDVLDPKVKNQSESTKEDQSSATNAVFENPVDSTTDFPDELASLVTDNSYGQASTSQIPLQDAIQEEESDKKLTQYVVPKSPNLSPSEINSHLDLINTNLYNIQEKLNCIDPMQLDYSLIQELFSTSPDIMPTVDITSAADNDSNLIEGHELVQYTGLSNSPNGNESEDLENELRQLTKYL